MADLVVLGTPPNAPPSRIVTGHVPFDPERDGDAIFEWLNERVPCSTFRRVADRFRSYNEVK